MNEMKVFAERCIVLGIRPHDCFAMGRGRRSSRNRLHHGISTDINNAAQKRFAVNFFIDKGYYAAWDMIPPNNVHRLDFSLDAINADNSILNRTFALVPKRYKNAHGETELVAVFTEAGIDEFVRYYQNLVNG